jgi:DNA-binding response OmpR family regulator
LRSTRAPIVLIVEDEPQVSTVYARALASYASEILRADTCARGLALAQARQPQLILLDHKLPDGWGADALARLRAIGVLARVILVSGYLTDAVTERARRLGALDVLDKPVSVERLVAAFQMAMAADGPLGRVWATDFEGSPAERWASLVLTALGTPRDVRIREDLARRVAMSLSRMKTTCKALGITAHDTRDLARVLGALVWARRLQCALEALLDIGDARTLERLIDRSGLAGRTSTATVRDFLDRQQFVPQDNEAFRLLRHALLGEPEPRPN